MRKLKRKRYSSRRNRARRYRRVRRNAQQSSVRGRATTITNDGGMITITYHSTPVVKFDDKKIILNTGGWKTVTTKTRMNQASNQFGLGYDVQQKSGTWLVHHNGKTHNFTGSTLTLSR